MPQAGVGTAPRRRPLVGDARPGPVSRATSSVASAVTARPRCRRRGPRRGGQCCIAVTSGRSGAAPGRRRVRPSSLRRGRTARRPSRGGVLGGGGGTWGGHRTSRAGSKRTTIEPQVLLRSRVRPVGARYRWGGMPHLDVEDTMTAGHTITIASSDLHVTVTSTGRLSPRDRPTRPARRDRLPTRYYLRREDERRARPTSL
jgi:hypothetical protein